MCHWRCWTQVNASPHPLQTKTFLVTMLPFVCAHVTGVQIFRSTLITFKFCCTVIKEVSIQLRFTLKYFSTTGFEASPITYGLMYSMVFHQLALELKSFPTSKCKNTIRTFNFSTILYWSNMNFTKKQLVIPYCAVWSKNEHNKNL